jgi:hypothetical protein
MTEVRKLVVNIGECFSVIVAQLVKIFAEFYGTRSFHYCVHKILPNILVTSVVLHLNPKNCFC